jgi:E3 ubiquitin-protein ligase TRIP12
MQALDKLSREHSVVVLRAGGLSASLSFIDFFASPVQRTCAAIAANACRRIPSDCVAQLLDVVPNLITLSLSTDSKRTRLSLLDVR